MIEPPILTVKDFNQLASDTLKNQIGPVLIKGEVSAPKLINNQWLSFDLVDEVSSLNCFGFANKLTAPEAGDKVKILAEPRIYIPRGRFSAQILAIELQGEGSLKKAYDKLLKKLEVEGLFDHKYKQTLPPYPMSIALITSKQGAALTDTLKILRERWPCKVKILPVKVQGIEAEVNIIKAIAQVNLNNLAELIILTRGGGSAEDLQTFNQESLARAVFASKIPIICGIGHEQDVSITELVADQRAATPTHAAQLATPTVNEVQTILRNLHEDLISKLYERKDHDQDVINSAIKSLANTLDRVKLTLFTSNQLINSLNPNTVLKRGYSIVRHKDKIIKSAKNLKQQEVVIKFYEDQVKARVL